MMRIVRVAASLLPALLFINLTTLVGAPPAAAKADPRTAAQIQAATDFSFEGVSLGMSLEAFLAKLPDAKLVDEESNAKVGLKVYRSEKLESADSARYVFIDDVLFQLTAFYTPERLKEMGGDTIPLRKLEQKLGKQDKSSPGITRQHGEVTFTAKWDFGKQNRRFRFVAAQKMSYISIVDTSKAGIAGQRETENADLGF